MQADPFVIYDQPPFPILEALNLDSSFVIFRALALKNANAISKENLAFITLKSSTSENGKGKYCKFFAILATVQFYL